MNDILERDGLSVDLLSSLSYWGGASWLMRYLVAKWFSEQGSLVMAVRPGQELVEMMRRIEDRFGISDLQLINISRPSAYGEYEPFEFVHSEEQLVKRLEQQAK